MPPSAIPTLTGRQSITSTGFGVSGGTLQKVLPATYATYRKIARHPTVALVRTLVVAPIVASEWSVDADDEIKGTDEGMLRTEFIKSQLLPLRTDVITTAMYGGIDYGWAPFEPVYVPGMWKGEQRVLLAKVKPLLVDITNIRIDPSSGAFAGFIQNGGSIGVGEVILPRENSLLVNFRVEGTDWYGNGLLENIRLTFMAWDEANAGAERYDKKIAGSLWVVHYPVGHTIVNGEKVDNGDLAETILNGIEAGGAVKLPRHIVRFAEELGSGDGIGDAWNIELMTHQPGQTGFIERMKYLDTNFVRGVLAPERTMLEGNFGTKAEAGVHANLALLIRELEHRTVTKAVNEQVVDTLLELNWGPGARSTIRLEPAPLSDSAKAFFQDIYTKIIAHPTESIAAIDGVDVGQLIDAVGLPKAEEVLQTTGGTSDAVGSLQPIPSDGSTRFSLSGEIGKRMSLFDPRGNGHDA